MGGTIRKGSSEEVDLGGQAGWMRGVREGGIWVRGLRERLHGGDAGEGRLGAGSGLQRPQRDLCHVGHKEESVGPKDLKTPSFQNLPRLSENLSMVQRAAQKGSTCRFT